MELYLPIAEVSISVFEIFLLSTVVGILSGLFGVGGGFLMTPFLIFLGIPPTYAVANEANNILATSVSGSTTHWLKNTLDYKMGLMIIAGGIAGTIIGILTFSYFKGIGKIDIVISLAYMYVLAIIGTAMLVQGIGEIDRARKKIFLKKKLHSHYWIHGLPLRMRFKKSKLYESAFTPIIIGLLVGFIAAIMGIGGAIGTVLGILTFTYFKNIGKIDIVISLAYMYILAIIGTAMLVEGVTEIDRARKKIFIKKKLHSHYWIHGLPLRMRFKKSQLYESAFTPIIIGLFVGFIAAIMGIGGAFILVPAMIYIIGMPTKLIPGTSLFVTIFVSAIVTILHAFNYGSIDLILVFILICGSIIGVQAGQKIGESIDSTELKTLLAVLLLGVGIAIAYDSFFAVHEVKELLKVFLIQCYQ